MINKVCSLQAITGVQRVHYQLATAARPEPPDGLAGDTDRSSAAAVLPLSPPPRASSSLPFPPTFVQSVVPGASLEEKLAHGPPRAALQGELDRGFFIKAFSPGTYSCLGFINNYLYSGLLAILN